MRFIICRFAVVVSAVVFAAVAAEHQLRESVDGAAAIAWVRFSDGPEAFEGKQYRWLGNESVEFQIDVAPKAGHSLELLWGAKSDTRTATLKVNGREVPLSAGGYKGWRWLTVPLPVDVKGERYDIVLSRSFGTAAFLGEVRLAAAGGDPNRPALAEPAYRIVVKTLPAAPAGPVFAEMRKIWDQAPPANSTPADAKAESLFQLAEKNARLANEALYRCRRYVDGWLAHADPVSGLIPRNFGDSRDYWNGRDSAADNYPFMVLTADLTDRPLKDGRLLEMLRTEQRLTSRIDRLPDDYSFSKKGWRREKLDLDAIMFDASEYVKDGLVPLTEWLGASPWSQRMVGITDDIWKNAPIDTSYGRIPTLNFEVCGDLLQANARVYWFTGDRKYLDQAIRLSDYFLLGSHHPTRDMTHLGLMDHGCEVINGLTEVYVAVSHAMPEKKKAYEKPLHEMFDRILEIGRNEHGLLYTSINPRTGAHGNVLCDTWGYDYDGFYTMYLVDGTESYREAIRKALSNLKGNYVGACWADKTADGFADSIEGAINLCNREPIATAADWIDSQTRLMWNIQKADGVIEGWHGDGNFARTSIMYALMKTAGLTVQPWREDVRFGAVQEGGKLYVSLTSDKPWAGKLVPDKQRHKLNMKLPMDYPRINQFPEWFTAKPGQSYAVRTGSSSATHTAEVLLEGLPVSLKPGQELRLVIEAVDGRQ